MAGTLEIYTSGSTDTAGRLDDADGDLVSRDNDSGTALNFRIEQDVSTGTYYIGVAGMTRTVTGNYTRHVRLMEATTSGSFDWIISNFEVRRDEGILDEPVRPGWEIALGAAVRNIGRSKSPRTRVSYYRSLDSTISSRDVLVARSNVVELESGAIQGLARIVMAPSSSGTYYYGACVDSASGESETGNNCSDGFRVVVEQP